MGRKKEWHENMQARFPKGTMERIDAMREHKESRTDFVRTAVFWELEEREKRANVKQSKGNRHG